MTGSGGAATTIYRALIEAELTTMISAVPQKRTKARLTQRSGRCRRR
jgi:hypothetical protein